MKRRNNDASVRRGGAHCISNTKETRVGGFQVQRQSGLHSDTLFQNEAERERERKRRKRIEKKNMNEYKWIDIFNSAVRDRVPGNLRWKLDYKCGYLYVFFLSLFFPPVYLLSSTSHFSLPIPLLSTSSSFFSPSALWNKESLCSPGWHWICEHPTPDTRFLGLQACATRPDILF